MTSGKEKVFAKLMNLGICCVPNPTFASMFDIFQFRHPIQGFAQDEMRCFSEIVMNRWWFVSV